VGITGRGNKVVGKGACAIKRLFISRIPSLWPEPSHAADSRRKTALAEPGQEPGPVSLLLICRQTGFQAINQQNNSVLFQFVELPGYTPANFPPDWKNLHETLI
jgi:hypothetical protein